MKNLKSIKNTSLDTISINSIDILSGQTVDLTSNILFKTTNGFNDIIKYYNLNSLEPYDLNGIMNEEEFIEYFNFFCNRFLQSSNYFKIYEFLTTDASIRYNNYSLTPKSVNYITDVDLRFARKETFTKGFLTNVEYYESSTSNINGTMSFSNPILNVNIQYYVNSIGYVAHRTTTRKWQTIDNTYSSDVKVTTKQYNNVMAREEGIQRRSNIINQLIIDVVNVTYSSYSETKTYNEVELMILPLLDSMEGDINKYLKGNVEPLIVNVMGIDNITYPWIDIITSGNTLHQFMISKLLDCNLSEGTYSSIEPI